MASGQGDLMPYYYRDDLATGDVAFEATGETLEEMFTAASEATVNTMVADLGTVDEQDELTIALQSEALDMLLFDFLGELIYYKDACQLLLRVGEVRIEQEQGEYRLTARAWGEPVDAGKHDLVVDVKAVTLHRFLVEERDEDWRCRVVLDV